MIVATGFLNFHFKTLMCCKGSISSRIKQTVGEVSFN